MRNQIKNKTRAILVLKKKVEKCRRCSLYRNTNKIVFGEGPPNAKVMIIGEAPGRKEVLFGRPFIGPAGKILDKLLKVANLDRKKIFITSVLKCRPVINDRDRKPKKEEIKACLPYLKKQLEIIDPKYLILLGEVAFSVFFKKERLKNFRGKWVEKEGKFYFPTYHPAAALRFPKFKKILIEDFKKLKDFLKI